MKILSEKGDFDLRKVGEPERPQKNRRGEAEKSRSHIAFALK
jgi:hypothetical protein